MSIAREVDKDLHAEAENWESQGENASARHAAREKQREAEKRWVEDGRGRFFFFFGRLFLQRRMARWCS